MEIEDWIDVGALSTGRRLLVLEQMKAGAQTLEGTEEVVARIDEATAGDEQTRTMEDQWGGVRSGNVASVGVKRLDGRLDKLITAVRTGAQAQRQGAAPDDPIHRIVENFLKQAMPEGVFAITSLPHADELSKATELLARLRGPLAGAVAELGLTRQVNGIAEILPAYRAALHGTGEVPVTFAPLREARQRGRRYLAEIVAMILGRYNRTDDPAHRAARERLLTPLWKQIQAARALHARRTSNGTEPGTDEPELPIDRLPGQPSGKSPVA